MGWRGAGVGPLMEAGVLSRFIGRLTKHGDRMAHTV